MMVDALKAAEEREKFKADQVLYLDYTNLYSVLVESKESMAEMKGKLNPNCLIFFPQRTVYNEDNYVSKTQSGDYRACKNIIITDKQPFYSPYKITVPAENYAAYSRKITIPMNGKASETGGEGTDYWGKAIFSKVDATRTTPNTPYMVEVEKESSGDDTSFEILQYGSDIYATPNDMNKDDYTFVGETAKGTIGNSNYTFTNYGSYSGKKLDKSTGWFYFAQNKFYNSKNLTGKYLYMYPFRAYFGHASNGAKVMRGFSLSFGDDATTGINDLTTTADDTGLSLSTRQGQLTVTASSGTTLTVVSASGVTMCRTTLDAGETKTVNLATGLYIVNGKKVVVP